MSGFRDSKDEPTKPATTGSSTHELLCAFQCQGHDRLRPVSSSQNSEDLQQCAMFDSDQDNANLIGREYIVTEKIFSKLPEEEKILWHAHDVEVKKGSLPSPEIEEIELRQAMKEVAKSYGRVFQSSENDGRNALPPELSVLMTATRQLHPELLSDPEKRHVSFAEEQAKIQIGISTVDEGTRRPVEQGKSSKYLAANVLEAVDSKEDEYLNDAVHRPAVHHMPSHVPALTTARLPTNGRFLSETRSAKF